jgi:hypothetical protein
MRGDLGLVIVGYMVGLTVLVGIIYFTMGAGKPAASNSTATPEATPMPTIEVTNVFSLPPGATPTPAPTPEPPEFCGDGTEKGKCSANRTLCGKESGALALSEDCTACGCGAGQKCDARTLKCFYGCEDGTPLGGCSNATPNYHCNANASLEINGFECGCPLGYQYDAYGSGPNSLNGCTLTCRTGPDCQAGK